MVRSEHRALLDQQGYVRLEGFIAPDLVDRLRDRIEALFRKEGELAGSEFRQEPGARRLANLVDKGEAFRQCVAMPDVLAYVALVLGPDYKLSSLNARSANPDNGVSQPLHCDMGALPDEKGYWVCNTVWMLDDFNKENGAIRVVPGSHRWKRLPQEALADPFATHPDEVLITGRAGDLVVINAHAWHGGTQNRTGRHRRAMHAFYCRRDRPQQQYQKRLLRPEVQRCLDEKLRWLLALDDPVNDELSAAGSGRSGFLK